MKNPVYNKGKSPEALRSFYDPEPPPDADLWFLPSAPEERSGPMPWALSTREADSSPAIWRAAEAEHYRGLLAAVQALARFGERLARFDGDISVRFALASVSAVLRGEGIWLLPEEIALYRLLRIASDDRARDLARASWAVRRLLAAGGVNDPLRGLHGFLGRQVVQEPQAMPQTGAEGRLQGDELMIMGAQWINGIEALKDLHPLTQAGFAYDEWRRQGLTPFDERLEPCVAAMRIGAGGLAPFCPVSDGYGIARMNTKDSSAARLAGFYAAIEAGALKGLMDLDRLAQWQERAAHTITDLSGRTPKRLIRALLQQPVVSGELVAGMVPCSRLAARRNLDLFVERGLIREVTGQSRYRFWTVQL